MLCPVQVNARIWSRCKPHTVVHLPHAKRFTAILLWRLPCTSAGTGVSWKCSYVTTSTGETRLCAGIQETRSVTSNLGCHGSSSSAVCPRVGKCVERRSQHPRRQRCAAERVQKLLRLSKRPSSTSPGLP